MAKLFDTSKSWTTNQWSGWNVLTNGKVGAVIANTSDTLVIYTAQTYDTVSGWYEAYSGNPAASPSSGQTYVLYHQRGFIEVVDNQIDSSHEGAGNGAHGIHVQAARAGMRVRVRGNSVRNCAGDGIHVSFADATRPIVHLTVVDNHTWDDQGTPTADTCVGFTAGLYMTQLVLCNNTKGEGTVHDVTGLTSGRWLVHGGSPQEWAGYGTPEGNISAPVGSIYRRRDGSIGTALYVKESGTGSTGWSSIGGASASTIPAWASQLNLVAGTLDPAMASTNVSFVNGVVAMTQARCWGALITSIVLQIGQQLVGGTNPHVFVGIYKSNGTRTSEMVSATVDALTSFQSSGVKTINFANTISVTPGEDIYVAVLVTGGPSTLPSVRANPASPINGNLSGVFVRQFSSGSGLTSLPSSISTTVGTGSQMPFYGLI